MTLHIERLGNVAAGSLFTIAHAHAGHLGALVCDPMVTLLRDVDGSWVPLKISTPFTQVVTAEARDEARIILRGEHCCLVKLVNVWLANVRVSLLRARDALRTEDAPSVVDYPAE
jgi:hypothetical protein